MTNDREDKRFILQQVLDHVVESTVGDIRLATLGGEGLEAELWRKAGIGNKEGWLIEASPTRGKKLIHGSDYLMFQGQLGKFRNMFESYEGKERGLRLFHWDLCGTVEPNIKDLASVLPLLERMPVSTLVVTVADARGNLALQKPKAAEKRIVKLFREEGFARIKHTLTELYGRSEDPRPTVIREMSTVGLIFEKMTKVDVMCLQRFFYLSRHIRMKTYVFHLMQRAANEKSAEWRRQQMAAWLGADVQWIKDGKANGIPPFVTEAEKRKVMVMENEVETIKTRLAPFMAMMNPEIRTDIERLLELASTRKVDEKALIADITKVVMSHVTPSLAAAKVQKAATPKTANGHANGVKHTNGSSKKGLRSRSQAAHKFSNLSLEEKDVLRFELLRAAKKGDKAYEKKEQEIIEKFGMSRVQNRLLQIGTVFARSQGKHRPAFLTRAVGRAADPKAREALLKELATLYDTTVEKLEKEIKPVAAAPTPAPN